MQGLDDLWHQELEQVDARMKESLRTKAQLSDRDIDNCYRSFVQDLLRRQSIVYCVWQSHNMQLDMQTAVKIDVKLNT